MTFGDHTYSQVIRGLKVLLPLVALGLLSTMFMLSRKIDPTAAIALSDPVLQEKISNQLLSEPTYDGNTSSGKAMTVTAVTVRPDPEIEGKSYGQTVDAVIDMENGGTMHIISDTGIVDEAADLAVLSGNVRIETSDGYVMTTSQLTSVLSRIEGESSGPVEGYGPPGTLSAGKMNVKSSEESDQVLLIFTKGVHLVYEKKTSTGAEQ